MDRNLTIEPADLAALATLEQKLCLVRDRVQGVVSGHSTGFFLHGSGGIGKSFTVLQHLAKVKASYKLYNNRMTGKALFLALQKAPDLIFVLEDMERITSDRDGQGVLRSACWAQPGHPRRVTWNTATAGEESFEFTGGLIVLSNRPLANLPELQAFSTRVATLAFEVTEEEAAALLRDLAAKGYSRADKRVIEPEKAGIIAEHLIAQCRDSGRSVDLRLWPNSCEDYLQWEGDRSACHWQDLVASRVRSAIRIQHETNHLSKEERIVKRRSILRKIMETADPKEWENRYCEETGYSRPDYFRRKGEIERGDFESEEK
jgi:hypothetical protein